jgi:hypothetical protein
MLSLAGSLLISAAAVQAAPPCTMEAADRAWVESLIDTWRGVSREALRIDPDPLPLIVLFDESCVWRVGATTEGEPHSGSIALPDGETIPAGLATFAGSFGPSNTPFVVMAMPSIWKADPRHREDPGLPLLLRAVFAHEMAHTLQAAGLAGLLNNVEKRLGLPEGLDDDIVQTRFEGDPEFRAAFAGERGLLYQAAAESNAGVRRALVATAVSMMQARRARFFTGGNAVFGELEDVFLGMEGLGNWVAYRVAVRDGISEADAVDFVRRDRTRWSQDEGLAAFLVIDALVPDWRDRVLEGRPTSVLQLLTDASRR